MTMFKALILFLALFAAPLHADVLAQMQGNWSGSGWARESSDDPKEAVRCRLKNTFEAGILTVKGRCAASGRKLVLSGEMKRKAGTREITGHWFNPDGLGSVRIQGAQSVDMVVFSLRAKDPETGAEIARTVTWRATQNGLHLQAIDGESAKTILSDIAFTR